MIASPECIKVVEPAKRQEGFSNWHPVIQLIIDYTNTYGLNENQELFLLLNEDLKKNQTLWYPSSFVDTTDVIYVNNELFPEFENNSPDIYIHNDGDYDSIYYFKNQTEEKKIYIIKEICLAFDHPNNLKEFYLFYIIKNGKRKWVMFFPGLLNEKLLKLFLKNSVEIKFIYSVCDGILNGMNFYLGERNQYFPLKFYSFFYQSLKTKYHISEYHHSEYNGGGINFKNENIIDLVNKIEIKENVNIDYLKEIENNFKNPIDVFNRFENYGNCNELWLRII